MSCGAALLPAALPVAGVAAAVGSSLGGGRGVARGVGSCVARGAGVRVAWCGVEGGLSRSRFSLMQPAHARDDPRCTAPGSANSCLDTVNLLACAAVDELQPGSGCSSFLFTQKSATRLHGREQVC